jgi:hypothetical protein
MLKRTNIKETQNWDGFFFVPSSVQGSGEGLAKVFFVRTATKDFKNH